MRLRDALPLMTLLVVSLAELPSASARETAPLILVSDVTGASGELDATLLNPAAAAGVKEGSLSIWMTLGPRDPDGGPREYAVAILDPGGALGGGLTASLRLAPGEALEWTGTYTLATKVGPMALGIRGGWTGVDVPGPGLTSRWAVDVGMSGRLANSLWFGAAASNLPIGSSSGPVPPIAGRVGLTLAPSSTRVYLLSAGLDDQDLQHAGGTAFNAGLVLPIGNYVRLMGRYEQELGGSASVLWSAGLGITLATFQLNAGYRSDGAYLIGIRSAI